jgi:hypothetical protein
VANYNFNLVNVPGVPAPAAPALTAAADTGVSNSDHITRLNNGSLASVLQFSVARHDRGLHD